VNTVNGSPDLHNPADPVSGYAGIPRNMTGIAEHMNGAGYETHMYGKVSGRSATQPSLHQFLKRVVMAATRMQWDCGMATELHTPRGRGYQNSLVYYHHVNDAWTMVAWSEKQCMGVDVVDLWKDNAPAHGLNNSRSCSQDNQSGCVYEDQLFSDRVLQAIREPNNTSAPFFIFWAPRIVHSPLQVPQLQLDQFSFIDDKARSIYHAMVYYIDEAIGNVTAELKGSGKWQNTLIVAHADNVND
jgi:arylsulfatase B